MTRTRRTAALAATALVAPLLAVGLPVGLASPSYAAADCLQDRSATLLAPTGCDDDTAPETTLSGVSTSPNADGWVATSTMTFTFAGEPHRRRPRPPDSRVPPDRPGAGARLGPVHQPPRRTPGLADSDAAYSFAVRAVDARDRATTYSANALVPTDDEPGEDLDATPAAFTWRQDTTAPVAFVTPDAYDEQTPQRPVVPSRQVPIRLNSNESDARFECLLDGQATSCAPGAWVLAGVASGRPRLHRPGGRPGRYAERLVGAVRLLGARASRGAAPGGGRGGPRRPSTAPSWSAGRRVLGSCCGPARSASSASMRRPRRRTGRCGSGSGRRAGAPSTWAARRPRSGRSW